MVATVPAAVLDAPATPMLVVAALATAVGWALHARAELATRPPVPEPAGDHRPDPIDGAGALEPPAIVALLTNGFVVPDHAVGSTVIDLAARQWLRFAPVDGELVVVTSGDGAAGDRLRPYEQQVLNHLRARAFHDIVSAATLTAAQHRLDRRWWHRWRRDVAEDARRLGLCVPRYGAVDLAAPVACAAVGLIACWYAVRDGGDDAVADSWPERALWFGLVAALAGLVAAAALRAASSAQRPTASGLARTAQWLGYRNRLRARIPAHASVLAPAPQQAALAAATAMGVAEHVLDAIPVVAEDPRRAWSETGGTARVVRVRYPIRPGYGQQPWKVGLIGAIVFGVALWLRSELRAIADGTSLQSLLDRVPGQLDLIETTASVLAGLCWLPILWGAWGIVAGVVDSLATRERSGTVVRARRPGEVVPLAAIVKPFADRGRFSTYLAVDDGRSASVTAWLGSERTAAPQGVQARMRATPLLGYVRSSEPIGTAARAEPARPGPAGQVA